MIRREFPILEFDPDREAFIRPQNVVEPAEICEGCVLCFFAEAIEVILGEYEHRVAGRFRAESVVCPVYELDYNGKKVALVQACVGAPLAAGQIEELTAMGIRKFIACGSCGVLRDDIAVGHLILPVEAVRDEGTSYHYMPPSREIRMDEDAVEVMERVLARLGIPFLRGKTWTTDAMYRETPAKIRQRRDEGCITVEMETSAWIAAARYNGVAFGQMLYAGDNLGGEVWDSRDFNRQTAARERVLRAALETAAELSG